MGIDYSNWNFGGEDFIDSMKAWESNPFEVFDTVQSAADKIQTQAYNSQEAQKERDWQEYMSSTAYQRMMNDASAAGINPYYLLSGGSSGASSASGAAASTSVSKPRAKQSNAKAFASVASAVIKLIAALA